MVNITRILNIEEALLEKLVQHLRDLGSEWTYQVRRMKEPSRADAQIDVKHGHQSWRLFLEARSRLFPGAVHEVAGRMKVESQNLSTCDVWVLGAPYVSERSADLSKKAGLGFIDLAGNCELRFGPVVVSRRVTRESTAERREQRSLVSSKALGVAAALALHPTKPWTQRDLAKETRTSLGMVNRILRLLAQGNFVEAARGGWTLRDRPSLLRALAGAYGARRHEGERFRTAGSLEELEARLDRASTAEAFRYVLTLESAAKYRAPFAPQTRLVFYVDNNPSKVAEKLGLRPESGAPNVEIRHSPKGEAFYACRRVRMGPESSEGRWIVNDLLLYLDLTNVAARGREQAEHLREVWDREGEEKPLGAEAAARWHEFLRLRDAVTTAMSLRDWRTADEQSRNAFAHLEGVRTPQALQEAESLAFHRWRAMLELLKKTWDDDPKLRRRLLKETDEGMPSELQMLKRYPPYRMSQGHTRYLLGLAEAIRAARAAAKKDKDGVEHHARLAAANFKVAVSRYTEGSESVTPDVEETRAWLKAKADVELAL